MRLEVVIDGVDQAQVWSRGHHDPCQFMRRAVSRLACEIGDTDEALVWLGWGHDAVRHVWWRGDPNDPPNYTDAAGPGVGAFPVTVIFGESDAVRDARWRADIRKAMAVRERERAKALHSPSCAESCARDRAAGR